MKTGWLVVGLMMTAISSTEAMYSSVLQGVSGQTGFAYQRWDGSDRPDVQQISVPLVAIVPLSPRLNLDLSTGLGVAHRINDGRSLSGRRDLRARLAWVPDRLRTSLWSVGLNMPWGKTRLAADEFARAAVVGGSFIGLQ
jgi:hypothetical protein